MLGTYTCQNYPDGQLPPTVESTGNNVLIEADGNEHTFFYGQYFTRAAIRQGMFASLRWNHYQPTT